MSYTKNNKIDPKIATYRNIVYYGPIDRFEEEDPILKKCQETNGDGLVIDDNTVYEIDCECYRQIQLRKAKKQNQENNQ